MPKQMAEEKMENSGRRGQHATNPGAENERGVAAEGLKRKHDAMDMEDPNVSQELTCALEQRPAVNDGVSKL